MLLSVVIPAFNERNTIAEIVRRVIAAPYDKEIVIVDDGSTDGTVAELRTFGIEKPGQVVSIDGSGAARNEIRLLCHTENQGKGAAVRNGIAATRGDVILIQDADLEYDPSDYPRLLQPILDGRADVVYGSRFTGSPRRVLLFWHSLGNHVLTFLSNLATNLNLTDMETCYKAFRADLIRDMPLRSNRFGIEPEITAKLARRGARIFEVPISYAGRSYQEGKKIGWRDGFAAIWTILRFAIVDDSGPEDPGLVTLRRMEALHRYNAWVGEMVTPHLGASVLEVGAGIGNMTRQLGGDREVVATDVEPRYLDHLRRYFQEDRHVAIQRFDLADTESTEAPGPFASIVCLNVLEHIDDDRAALRRLHDRLEAGGRLVLVVPAHPCLYGEMDRAIHHYRRYRRDDLAAKLEETGYVVEEIGRFNALGVPGWFFNGRVLRRRTVPGIQARLNSWLVPWLRIERRLGLPFGLSLLAVARRA